MTTTSCLASMHCIPCQGGVPPLNAEEANQLLTQLHQEWVINAAGHLFRKFSFSTFIKAMAFANEISTLAEQEAHHPNLLISWGSCEVEIWTHKINGLTQSDFILAAKIDQL